MMRLVNLSVADEVTTIAFNRPAYRNALNRDLTNAITEALRDAVELGYPLVLRSATAGMFLAGADLHELRVRTTADSLARINAGLFRTVCEFPFPTIALVDGAALGGGCELAMACDFRITTDSAQWGLPEVRLGIIPSAGALTRLAPLVGQGMARELILTGRRIDGVEAHRIGLANRVTPAQHLDDALSDLLAELKQAAPLAVRLAKEAMRVTGDEHRLVDAAAQALCLSSEQTQLRLSTALSRA
jgi:enoyl-CoA hydratase/carnithine racemase